MAKFGDEYGMFWETEERVTTRTVLDPNRPLPPIPETGWQMPTEFPDLRGHGNIALDVESYDPDLIERGCGSARDAYICGIAIGTEAGYRQYFPVAHQMGPNCDKARVVEWASEQLSRPGQAKVGAHLAYDLEMLSAAGVKVEGPFIDVQIAEPLINENKLNYSLENIAQDHLGEGKDTDLMKLWLQDAFGKANYKGNIWRAPAKVVGPYAESDVDLPLRIWRKQKKLLEEQKLMDIFLMEGKLIPMLVAMRRRGVRANAKKAEELLGVMQSSQDRETAKIKRLVGFDIDIWSSESLARAYDAAGVEYPLTAKTKKPSFTKEWLKYNDSPISDLVNSARHYDKFKGTFLQGYIIEGNVNGRIHTTFNQLKSDNGGTISGRFSSSGPNLQNIPVRTAEGKLIRQMFEPEVGMKWWKFDWSQIEYRLIAHYAFILKMRGADDVVRRYLEDAGVDYHQIVADMTGLSRSNAKNLNFGLAYGQGIDLLCKNLGVDRATGERIIREYHGKAPYVRPLMKKVSDITSERGYLTTYLGRRRHFDMWEKGGSLFPEWVPGARRAFMHKTLNGLIQGSAADIMKLAMVDYYESGVMDVLGPPHLTVHDELDGSMDPNDRLHVEALAEVKNIMENGLLRIGKPLKVPLRADGGVGDNWGSLE